MRNRRISAAGCWLLFLLSRDLHAQFVLAGVVRDNASEPVRNALVELIDQADTTRVFSDSTDGNGLYFIQIIPAGVSGDAVPQPSVCRLHQNYPNPFNPSTVIPFELFRPARLRIDIFDIRGRRVRTLFNGHHPGFSGQVEWDGTDEYGRGVSAGMYLAVMNGEGTRIAKKMILTDGCGFSAPSPLSAAAFAEDPVPGAAQIISDPFLLRVTGSDIETWEQEILIDNDKVIHIDVFRAMWDVDGNCYRAVRIGDQWWTQENLKVTHYRNGDPIPQVTGNDDWENCIIGAYCGYNNDDSLVTIYGRFYNWYAVNDARRLTPEGWHVPGDEEWQILIDYLGGVEVAGGKMKETGLDHWKDPNLGATNESGFTALPGGCRLTRGAFINLEDHAYFWSSTDFSAETTWGRVLFSYLTEVGEHVVYNKIYGFSVRCVKN